MNCTVLSTNRYIEWARADELVIGLNAWHWMTMPDHKDDPSFAPFYWGVDLMPVLQKRLVQLAHGEDQLSFRSTIQNHAWPGGLKVI
jgi:hypothetical protein